MDSCSLDWFAVTSIFESLLERIKVDFPNVKIVCVRSDEAGCYHTTDLLAAIHDVSDRSGIAVERYDFSEPQQGKDVCDRVLCPTKTSIRRYCAEGNDIFNASDMRKALEERPVKGTTAAVCTLDESSENLKVLKIKIFSDLHKFQYEKEGLRTWRAYDVGPGKLIQWKFVYVKHQGTTNISLDEGHSFFKFSETRQLSLKNDQETPENTIDNDNQPPLFVCPEEGCSYNSDSFPELELHMALALNPSKKK
ncbi:Hypothetical predicted protein [Paramuricea clavata]|uniref:Uncharacterized protein n=1 Tax=Paramuricea clavata TaxID=317549 RepID=A0A6S7KZR1_PARCT|nr:Hypothetical predicted protein [Paramuricea clavata]